MHYFNKILKFYPDVTDRYNSICGNIFIEKQVMDISRISGSGGSAIWDALMAMSKKTVKPTAVNTVSNDISNVTTSPVSTINKSETSKKTDFINSLNGLQATDSGLALLKALNGSVSKTSLIDILQTDNPVTASTDGSVFDKVLQSIGSSGNTDKAAGGSKELLSALMSSSNAFRSTSALSSDNADPFADAASVEKTLNSFMRVPDISKYTSGRQSLENMLSKFDVTV
ncbi:MAG: hypothetical protein ACM31E_10725 [Fibrobacterota bacterium]